MRLKKKKPATNTLTIRLVLVVIVLRGLNQHKNNNTEGGDQTETTQIDWKNGEAQEPCHNEFLLLSNQG